MQAPEIETASSAPKRKSAGKTVFLITLITGLILCAALGLILYLSYQEYLVSPKLVEGAYADPSAAKTYTLTPDQAAVVAKYGFPDSFTITFYQEEFSPDFTGEVRDEIWRYYNDGVALTFYEGILVNQETIPDPPTSWVPLPYQPDQFTAYASLKSILATAAIKDYFELPLEEELIDNGSLYYAPGLTFGTVNDRLVYVETISMKEGEE
jgi:hypothetical protein